MGLLIPFGEYLPDLSSLNNQGSANIANCVPLADGYAPFPCAQAYSSNALDSRAQGAFSCRDIDNTIFHFAGDASKLYLLAAQAWGDVSKAGGYSTGSDEIWSFAQYGRTVVATNLADPVQAYTMGDGVDFADLAGNPPKARYVASAKDFLFLAGLENYPHRVQCSALGDPEDWAVSVDTGATYWDLDPGKGFIRGIVGGEYITVIQERAITRFTFIGQPAWWQRDEVESGRGTQAPLSIIKIGSLTFYWGYDSKMYAFDGNGSVPIGDGKVDSTFANELSHTYKHRISAAADPRRTLVLFGCPDDSGETPTLFGYNWANGRWCRINLSADIESGAAHVESIEILHQTYTGALTLEDLDAISASLDDLEFSLDSTIWSGGNLNLAAFGSAADASANKLVLFNGANYEATLETKEFQPMPNGTFHLMEVRNHYTGTGATTETYALTRNRSADSFTSNGPYSENSGGYTKMRVKGTMLKLRQVISGFERAAGIELIDVKSGGRR